MADWGFGFPDKELLTWIFGPRGGKLVAVILFVIVVITCGFVLHKNINTEKESDMKVPVTIENNVYENGETSSSPSKENTVGTQTVAGVTYAFNPEDWIVDSKELKAEDGFYCSYSHIYQYSTMWSRKAYAMEHAVVVRYDVKNKEGVAHAPTTIISFGQYIPKYSPKLYYRIQIMDGNDFRSIRLYNNKDNKGKDNLWLPTIPDVSSTIKVDIVAKIPNDTVSKLLFFVDVLYSQTDGTNRKNVNNTLSTAIADVQLKLTEGQVGIGIRNGSCIRPLTVDIHNL